MEKQGQGVLLAGGVVRKTVTAMRGGTLGKI